MAEETQLFEAGKGLRKRRLGQKKGSKGKKKQKMFRGSGQKVKVDNKMKKLFRKRARDYNSDDDQKSALSTRAENAHFQNKRDMMDGNLEEDEELDSQISAEENTFSEEDNDEPQPGITKFAEGCRAFKLAFTKIMKRNISDDSLGPVLSGHKKLVVEKLAEEEAEQKVMGVAKKEKHLMGEKGHMQPANFLDTHERFLIGVATKGVVKLFNAVNKAQAAQKGLNPSRSKDAKALNKRRKQAFFSELGKTSLHSVGTTLKVNASKDSKDGEGPAWAPLRDNYMLTNSKLKDWDKMQDTSVAEDTGRMMQDSSDEDD